MKGRTTLTLVGLFVLAVLVLGQATSTTVTIIHTANIYGNVLPFNYFTNTYESKGLVQIYSYVSQLRQKSSELLLVDTGNLLYGSPFGDYFLENDASENPVVTLFNQIGYDVFVPGTFELTLESEKFEKNLKSLKTYVLASNLVNKFGFIKNYYVKVFRNGLKVATVGVVPPYGNLASADYVNTIKSVIQKLKSEVQPDVIILATSAGITYDPVSGKQISIQSALNLGDVLVKEFNKDVDIFLFGNQTLVYTGINKQNKVFSIPGSEGTSVNQIDISLSQTSGKWKISKVAVQNVKLEKIKPVENVMNWAQQFETYVEKWLDTPVIKSNITIGFNKYMAILEDTLVTEIVNKSIIEYTNSHIGIWNVFNPNFEGFIEGDITRRDLYALVGRTTTVKTLKLTGKQVKEIIMKSLNMLSFKDGKVVFEKSLVSSPWIYDLFENLEYEVVINKKELRKIQFMGKVINDSDVFVVSVPSVRTFGQNAIISGAIVEEFEIPVQKILFSQVKKILPEGVLDTKEDNNRVSLVQLTYTVKPGDTLARIAYRLGIATSDEDLPLAIVELMTLNPIIKNPNLIRPGWEIVYYKKYLDLIPPLRELFEAR
ncbi:5'-nucleotidase C-terminal domain-containing protein [Fervidobacterium pennivorans]|uniref:5'-nucleotidase C-terminal domain-containing protein n=1 Tax=Fervidobacterium pennivorans TaxID=93466 RepID=UPI0014367C2A|nr:5'-nucleotidase C-terminal domain-containing protein [Fervidobacterium pennivorans]QIV78487.1 LysM peptidoglycan-binding domain-containing protein [Fervidobacterium pennivorans subsp. keratinolyticus]